MSRRGDLVALLPHRPPMLFLDGAEMGEDRVLTSRQRVPDEDPVLSAHFPGFPVWPGALLLEAMAQTTAVYLLHERGGLQPGEVPVLGAVDCRFLQPVRPGTEVSFETRLVRRIGELGLFSVEVRGAAGEPVARGRLTAGIVPLATLDPPTAAGGEPADG